MGATMVVGLQAAIQGDRHLGGAREGPAAQSGTSGKRVRRFAGVHLSSLQSNPIHSPDEAVHLDMAMPGAVKAYRLPRISRVEPVAVLAALLGHTVTVSCREYRLREILKW
jgi:hypothetical protein